MNKTLRKAMLSTICMLVVAVVSLTGVTYAWFSQGTSAEVKGLNVQVEAADGGIMIAGAKTSALPTDASAYSNSLNLNEPNFGGDDGVSPVSTVGNAEEFEFFTAKLVTPTEITTELDTTDDNVFKYYLFLRNENSGGDMTINLGGNGDSSVETIITNAGNKEIANAARLGLRYVATKSVDGGSAAQNGSVNGNAAFGIFSNGAGADGVAESKEDVYLGVKAASADENDKFNKNTITSGVNDSKLASVDPLAATEWTILVPDNSIVVVELLVWVEGQDAACINANANSTFGVNLVFDKVPA